jgi:hypothetical protein
MAYCISRSFLKVLNLILSKNIVSNALYSKILETTRFQKESILK